MKYNIAGYEVSNLEDLLDVYHDIAELSETSRNNIRACARTVKELREVGLNDLVGSFSVSEDPDLNRERIRYFKSYSDRFNIHILSQRENGHNRVSAMLSSLLNAMRYANDYWGSRFLVLKGKEIMPKEFNEAPVKTIPTKEIDKILSITDDAFIDITKEPELRDALFLAQTILYTALRPSDACALRLDNLKEGDANTPHIIESANAKTGKVSMAVVPFIWVQEFRRRANDISLYDRPMTAYSEQAERNETREYVVKEKGKKGMSFLVRSSMIFRFNNLEKINDDEYYVRTYGRRLFKTLVDTKRNDYKSYINQAILLCGVKFETTVYRRIGRKNIKEVITEKDVTSYWLRRSAITRLLKAGLTPDAVKISSGHSATSKSFNRYVDKSALLTSEKNLEILKQLNK